MKRYSKSEIIPEIKNGNEEVLVYLSRKYFPAARKLLRIRGLRDEMTPEVFSDVLVSVYLDLQNNKSEHIDFDSYFTNALNERIRMIREDSGHPSTKEISADVASQCVSIMDDQSQRLLFSRVAERMSYERIREKFQFSNAVIAQYEVNKALSQLEGIVKLRLNFS